MPDGGLITPVLKDADSTDIYTMSRNWADLVRPLRRAALRFGGPRCCKALLQGAAAVARRPLPARPLPRR